MKNNKNFWKKKKVTAFFGLLSLVGSFFFLNRSITGNTIVNETMPEIIQFLPLVGVALLVCSGILIVYSLNKN